MMAVYSAQRLITLGLVAGVLDVVRSKCLELALDLQARFPDAGEKDGPTVNEAGVGRAVTHITTNIVGSVKILAGAISINERNLQSAMSARWLLQRASSWRPMNLEPSSRCSLTMKRGYQTLALA
jgi:hypothetical protein